jgi:hypothetical protein
MRPETPPGRQVASAQSIADRMAPFVTDVGFGAEWALFGPAIVEQHIDAAFEAFLVALGEPAPKCVTFKYNLTTGESSLTEGPGQGGHRVILDGSNECDRLAAYRGFCRLFNRREQQMLAAAGEILIVSSPAPEWIVENEPNPDGPCDGLQLIVVLPPRGFPPFDDSSHLEDCRLATHLAVSLARMRAGLAITMWFLSESHTKVSRSSGHGESVHVVLGKDIHESATARMLLDISSQIEIRKSRIKGAEDFREAVEDGRIGATIFSTGRSAAYWLGILSGLGRTFTLSGFQAKDLPAAFARRPMLVYSDSGGFSIEGTQELPVPMPSNHSILVWEDDPERPKSVVKEKATVLQ